MVLMSSQEVGSPSRRDALVNANPDNQVAIPALSRLDIIMCSVAVLNEAVRELPMRRWEGEGEGPLGEVPEATLPCVADMSKSVVLGIHSTSPLVRYLRMAKVEWEVAPVQVKSALLHQYVAQWAARLLGPYPESWPVEKSVDRHPPSTETHMGDTPEGVPGKRPRCGDERQTSRNGFEPLDKALHRDPVAVLMGRQSHSERLLQRLGGGGPRTVPSANVLTAGKFSTDLLRGVSHFLRNDCGAEALALARSAVRDSQQTESGELTVMSSHIHHHIAAMHVSDVSAAMLPLGLVLRSTRAVDAVALGGRQDASTSPPTGAKLTLFIQMRITALLAACEVAIHFPTAVPDEIRQALRETSLTVHTLLQGKISALEKVLPKKPKAGRVPPTTGASVPPTCTASIVLAGLSMADNLSHLLPLTAAAFKDSSLRQIRLLGNDASILQGKVTPWAPIARTASGYPVTTCNKQLSRSYRTAEEEVAVREAVSRVSCLVLCTLRGDPLPSSPEEVLQLDSDAVDSLSSHRQVVAAECVYRGLECLMDCSPQSLAVAVGLCYGGLDLCHVPPPCCLDAPVQQMPRNAAAVSVVVSLLSVLGECGRRMSQHGELTSCTSHLRMSEYLQDRVARSPQEHLDYALSTLAWLAGPSVRSSAALAALSRLDIVN
jgi:hypothetical protein